MANRTIGNKPNAPTKTCKSNRKRKTSRQAGLGKGTREGVKSTTGLVAKPNAPTRRERTELAPEAFALSAGEEEAEHSPWQWREGPVDSSMEHFELRCGEAFKCSWDAMITAALVSRIQEGLVNVEFLIDRDDSRNSEIIKQVVGELDFYLIELRKRDPWKYLQYHCTTASNVYSPVHWSFLPQ